MRVVHLSTQDQKGGAARAAWRLHHGLLAAGADSSMFVRTKLSDADTVTAADDGTLATWHEQILTPWLHRHLPPDSPWFTSSAVSQDILSHPSVRNADVLHLHWVAEWLNAGAIASLVALDKPVFWTFHDLWAVTCGNHYAGENTPTNDAWQTGASLPEEIREIGRRAFSRKRGHLATQSIRVIAPSQWMGRMSRDSIIGAGWQTEVVPNGIDTSIFQPSDAALARARWQLPAGKLLLLFGCASINERRKGFHVLVEALHAASLDREKVALVLFGADKPDVATLPIDAHHVGSIASEADMASLYSAADAYLCPTLEDNLPNTVLESLACGTPVIGFATGGVPDLVRHEHNGLLSPCGDATALSACLARFVTDTTLAQHLKTTAQQADKSPWSLRTQAQRCLELYRAALSSSTAIQTATLATASLAAGSAAPMIVPGEEDWMLRAAAASAQRAAAQETQVRAKLEDARAKLDEAKQTIATLKSEARTSKGELDTIRRKPWRAWFRRR